MEETEKKKRFHTPLWFRITAGIVAFAILVSLVANAAVAVRIELGDDPEAAVSYLVGNTGYVNAGVVERLEDKVQTLSEPVTLEDYYRLAGTQIAQEDYQGALQSIEQCIQLEDGTDQALHIDLLMKKGCLLVMLGRDADALIPLDLVLGEVPGYADALLVKAQIYAQQQDMGALIPTLEAYLETNTHDHEIRKLLAQTMFSVENYTGARDQYRKLLELSAPEEDMTQIRYLHGLACVQTGDMQEAEESFLIALEKDASLDGIHYYIGVCQMSREAYAEAVDNLTVAVDSGSLIQLSRYSRGVCGLMIEGYDLELAVEDIVFAAEYDQPDADPAVTQQAADLLAYLISLAEQEDTDPDAVTDNGTGG